MTGMFMPIRNKFTWKAAYIVTLKAGKESREKIRMQFNI
jgi:hypothetical protein